MTRRLSVLFALALVGCPSPTTSPGSDAASSPDVGGTDAATMPDTGADAASPMDAGADAASATDAGADAASTTDASATDAGADASGAGADASTPAADHLLITEVAVGPAASEFLEITNPTSAAIALDAYYVSDNAVYHRIATGAAWAPMETPGTDFLVGFPAGASIGAGATITLALTPMFETTYGRCATYVAATADVACSDGRTARALRVPTNGALDVAHTGALLSDSREMLMLFHWDGVATTVDDVDYVTWGATFDAGATRVDKTGVAGYAPDTAAASQRFAAAPASGQSLVRCGGEIGETTTGGNGLGGHDETSEDLATAFHVVTTPTPGTTSACP